MTCLSLRAGILAVGLSLLGPQSYLAQDWKTAQVLPGIDMNGLSAKQKATVLKLLREQGCSCGCGMKLAECRIADPACAYSTNLAKTAIECVKSGKSEPEVIAMLAASQWAHLQEP